MGSVPSGGLKNSPGLCCWKGFSLLTELPSTEISEYPESPRTLSGDFWEFGRGQVFSLLSTPTFFKSTIASSLAPPSSGGVLFCLQSYANQAGLELSAIAENDLEQLPVLPLPPKDWRHHHTLLLSRPFSGFCLKSMRVYIHASV